MVHDVLKHFQVGREGIQYGLSDGALKRFCLSTQTVDGQLLCWKIADNEIIRVGCRGAPPSSPLPPSGHAVWSLPSLLRPPHA